jgi:polyferredoxin
VGVLLFSLFSRHEFRVDVVRDRGTLARLARDGFIENVYRLQLMNASEKHQTFRISAEGLSGLTIAGSSVVTLAPAEIRWFAVNLQVPPESARAAGAGAHPIEFKVMASQPSGEIETVQEKSTFMVPR